MNHMQALIDGLGQQMQRERAKTQMTLGQLIDILGKLPPDTVVPLSFPHSYRGYYHDIAFESGTTPAAELLKMCREAMGQVFEGYKGGEYVMGALTPVWVASWGSCGLRLMSVATDGSLTVEPHED